MPGLSRAFKRRKRPGGQTKELLRLPEGTESKVEVIGTGAAAAPAVVALLTRLGVLGR